jgi:arginyl-tRNA synthetase
MDYEEAITKLLKKHLPDTIEITLEVPPDRTLGDFAFPCFPLAKVLKKSPQLIAHDLAAKLHAEDFLEKVVSTGPYVNFFLNKKQLAVEVLHVIHKQQEKYGSAFQKQKVMVEFSSPNTNKPLHLGHMRNIALGDAVSRILAFLGNYVVKACLVNDRGIHICKSMLAYKKWGKNKSPNVKGDMFVGKYYVMFAKQVAECPELEEEVRTMLQQWEQGDEETVALWKKMNQWVYDGFEQTYKKLGISFDTYYYESDVYSYGKEVVLDGLKRDVFVKKDGAVYALLEDVKLPDKVLIRSDGTTIYMTQDLYLAQKKFQDYNLTKSIYVVGSEQDMHFKQLFAILKKLGLKQAEGCFHLSYGMVLLPEGKMKSREGTAVDADGLMAEMETLAAVEIRKRQELSKKETERRAHHVGIAALKFHLLKIDPVKYMVYNPKESLSFEGETGPYVQYTHARIASILRKHGKELAEVDVSFLGEKGLTMARMLEQFPTVVECAGLHYKPSLLCRYLLDLCQEFNSYYHDVPVLKAENEAIKEARLYLLAGVKHVLHTGLGLLGIEALEEM